MLLRITSISLCSLSLSISLSRKFTLSIVSSLFFDTVEIFLICISSFSWDYIAPFVGGDITISDPYHLSEIS